MKLRDEIISAGLREDITINICNKYGDWVKKDITIKDLFEGRNKTILNKQIDRVRNHEYSLFAKYTFVLRGK